MQLHACLQKDDLARLYRLFQRVPKGLDPVAETFKRHVEAEGMKLVKEATEAMEARKDKDAGGSHCMPGRHDNWVPSAYHNLSLPCRQHFQSTDSHHQHGG